MAKAAHRSKAGPRGTATPSRAPTRVRADKLSVSLGVEDVQWVTRQAKRLGTSVSAVIASALADQRRAEARDVLLASLGDKDIAEAESPRGAARSIREMSSPGSHASRGFTFDTGALIALERGDHRMRVVMRLARLDNVRIVVPTVVLGEWWRGRSKVRELILASVQVEPLGESLAKMAGEALAKVRSATFVDAVVMASAAQRGEVVYTSDQADLDRLWSHFKGVRRLLPAT